MIKITEITDEAKQQFTLIGENQESISFYLEYKPSQQSWYFNLEYLNTTANGLKLVNSPNVIRNYKNVLPFGISCIVTDGTDPYFIDDFINDRVQIFLLNEAEVVQIEELFRT